jgi:hypothetical protein
MMTGDMTIPFDGKQSMVLNVAWTHIYVNLYIYIFIFNDLYIHITLSQLISPEFIKLPIIPLYLHEYAMNIQLNHHLSG